ncbi:polyprenyl synthetase family protein [Pseudogracilibacillus sp. SO30301A]|uniref:polyprenyl synthetase family protein n=1 Tax=Pseudogracilibacillus sp. SO30301A TaxID=3098291 RepID=UPI00300E57E9
MSINIDQYIEQEKHLFEMELKNILQEKNIPKSLLASMSYSLFAGGKRLRPILLLASYSTFASNNEKVLKTAAALEMIHTYSLVHDDLPAMDDDDYRRGKLTNHKKFDEATAILAGDALLTYAFELIANDDLLNENEKVFIIRSLATASGPEGMVAGQILDMEGETKSLTLEELETIHVLKTGRLINFAITAGAFLANASDEQLKYLEEFAYYLGLIFQVQDDILDVIGDPEKIGKPIGSDVSNDKSTYPNLLGLDGAQVQKEKYVEKAEKALQKANAEESYLYSLLCHFSERDH